MLLVAQSGGGLGVTSNRRASGKQASLTRFRHGCHGSREAPRYRQDMPDAPMISGRHTSAMSMWISAIFGLVGVVVGGVITWLAQWLQERRGEQRASRAAFRLVASDLYVAQALVKPVIETGRWGPENLAIPLEAWAEHRATVAAQLESGDQLWTMLEGAVLGVRRLNDARDQARAGSRGFTESELRDFRRIGAHIDKTLLLAKPHL